MSYYIQKNKNQKFELKVKDILSKAGGTATIYNVQGTDDFVLKLYKDFNISKFLSRKFSFSIKEH